MKRIIYIVLATVIFLSGCSALAEPVTEVVVARGKEPYEVKLDSNHPYACLDAEGYPSLPGTESNYHYKFENGVLTMRNAVTNNKYAYVLVEKSGDLQINLVGNNRIKLIDNKKNGTLTFSGSGNLQTTSINSNGNLTFDGTGTIEAGYLDDEGNQHASKTAVFCSQLITVNSGTLNARASNSWIVESPSPGGTLVTDPSYAIWGKGDMVVNGGKIIARSGETPDADSYAIGLFGYVGSGKVSNTLTIKGGEIDAIAGKSRGGYTHNSWVNSFSSIGVFAKVILEGGSLTTKSLGIGSYGSSCGVSAKVTQSGGTLIAEGGPITSYSSYRDNEFSYGVSEIEFTGGMAVMNGSTYAVRKTTIADEAEVTASTKKNGSEPSKFDPANVKNYRYLKLKLHVDENNGVILPDMPATGDDSSLGAMLVLLVGVLLCMYAMVLKKNTRYQ